MNHDNESLQTVPRSYLHGFVVKITLLFSAIALLTIVALFFSPQHHGVSYADSFQLFAELDRVLVTKSLALFSFVLLIILLGVIIISIAYSHRVAGPLHKLGMHSRTIAAGDLTGAVRLRQHDVLHGLATDINRLSGHYRARIEQLQARTRELAVVLENAEKQAATKERPGTVNEISERIDEIRELLNQIKL